MSDGVVHVVDDDAAMRDSLSFLLSSADISARVYDSAAALLARVDDLEAGCIVTDIRMPGMSGLELVHELKKREAPHPIIVLTGHADVALAVEAMKAGVADFVEKPFDETAFLNSVRQALEASASAGARAGERAELERRHAQLTGRERDVFGAIVMGDSNKEAAIRLGISPRTVEIYRAHVMSKMQAESLSELVRMALRLEEPKA